MHLHAWNSPPETPLTDNDWRYKPYLIEYSDALMREKVDFMTKLLQDTFQTKMRSHRAGRWAFDERYARLLIEYGYEVDCSVTPKVNWKTAKGAPQGTGARIIASSRCRPIFLMKTTSVSPAIRRCLRCQ
jgi:hypothetical protein